MSEKILERIRKEAMGEDLLEYLTEKISSSDLQSLLMSIFKTRTENTTPGQLLEIYKKNRFVLPSDSDPVILNKIDDRAFSCLPDDFQVLELSPVCPLGNCSAITSIDQNSVISTARNSEVVADTTNVLTLEAARQRKEILAIKKRSKKTIKLGASHRLIRTQSFEDQKYSTHFRTFCLCSAGRDRGSFLFETENLIEHISSYLLLLSSIKKETLPEVLLTDMKGENNDLIENQCILPLTKKFPGIKFRIYPERKTALKYYQFICFSIRIKDKNGNPYDIVDGGFTNWTQEILSNKKERLLISGMGTELLSRILFEPVQ